MSLMKAFVKFEEEWGKAWNKYVQHHKDLDVYRGVDIGPNNIDAINKIISNLQDTFIELNPSINFILQRGALCQQAVTEYQKFMDDIKTTGATPEKEEEAHA